MSWLADITGLSEADIALPTPSWTGTVDTATSGGITPATASGLLDSIGKSIGSVADFGFNVQRQQLAVQSQAQDTQLKKLLGTLGFQTQVVQAQSAADIAKINAQKAVVQAQGGSGSISPMMLILGLGAFYLATKK